MQSAEQLGQSIGVQAACSILSVPRSSLYRARRPRSVRSSPKLSPRAFSQAEKLKVRQELNSERFQDCAPREVYATLMDEGQYLCSWRSTLCVYNSETTPPNNLECRAEEKMRCPRIQMVV